MMDGRGPLYGTSYPRRKSPLYCTPLYSPPQQGCLYFSPSRGKSSVSVSLLFKDFAVFPSTPSSVVYLLLPFLPFHYSIGQFSFFSLLVFLCYFFPIQSAFLIWSSLFIRLLQLSFMFFLFLYMLFLLQLRLLILIPTPSIPFLVLTSSHSTPSPSLLCTRSTPFSPFFSSRSPSCFCYLYLFFVFFNLFILSSLLSTLF